MKKINFILCLIVLTASFACSRTVEGSEESNESSGVQKLAATESSSMPGNLITVEKAKEQLKFYQDAHPGESGDQFALQTWISIEDLEEYIAYVKRESSRKNITVTGIGFIHTQKKEGKSGLQNKGNADYELSLMYAPTYKEGTKNTAFDPMNSTVDNPMKLSVLLGNASETDSTQSKDGGEGKPTPTPSGIGNNIFSCPSVCQ
jgi:hypothetical protein